MCTRLDPWSNTCQLIIYELATGVHEKTANHLENSVNEDLGCWENLIDSAGTMDVPRSSYGQGILG